MEWVLPTPVGPRMRELRPGRREGSFVEFKPATVVDAEWGGVDAGRVGFDIDSYLCRLLVMVKVVERVGDEGCLLSVVAASYRLASKESVFDLIDAGGSVSLPVVSVWN